MPYLPKLSLKLLTFVTLFVLMFGGFVMVENSFAQPADGEIVDPANPLGGPGSGEVGDVMELVWNFVAKILYIFFVAIPVVIASLAGQLLNLTINELIIGMGQLINYDSGIGFAINNLWTVIRDVMNILFIFALIYLGIKIILSSDDSGTRRALGLLIAAALLVNFSLLITKTMIDFSNIMAYEVYQILGGTATSGEGGFATITGISGAFFNATGVQELVIGAQSIETSGNTTWGMVIQQAIMMFMTMVLFIVLTVVFVGGAAMIFVRFIALILYMIFSPVMFLGWVLPSFKKYQDNWWNGFFKKAFFAPAFLFMLYISLITITQLRAGLGQEVSQYQAAIYGSAGATGILLVYGFAIGMLVASIIIAQQMGMAGANATMGALTGMKNQITGRLNNGFNNIKAGAMSGVYRNTMGRYYKNRLDRIDELENEAANGSNALNRTAAKIRLARMTALSGNSTVAGMRANAEAGKNYQAGGGASYADRQKYAKEAAVRTGQAAGVAGVRTAIENFKRKPTEENRQAMERALRDAPTSQIVEMAKSSSDRALLESVAGNLSDSQWKAISDDKEISDKIKSNLGGKRGAGVAENLKRVHKDKAKDAAAPGGIRALSAVPLSEVIHKADASELKAIGLKDAVANAEYLSDKQISDWKDLTPSEKAELKGARKEQLVKKYKESGGSSVIFKRFENDTERSKLPKEILTDAGATLYMNKNVLSKMVDNDTLGESDRATIKNNILTRYPAGSPEGNKWREWFDKNNAGQRF